MSFDWKTEEINNRLSKLLDYIVSVALADSIISDEEDELLEVIKEELWATEERFASIIESHSSLDEAENKIRDIFEDVLNKAAAKAKEDGTITADELVLLDKLAKFLRNEDISNYLSE